MATRIYFNRNCRAVAGRATERVAGKRGKSRRARLSLEEIFAGIESGGGEEKFEIGSDGAFGYPNLLQPQLSSCGWSRDGTSGVKTREIVSRAILVWSDFAGIESGGDAAKIALGSDGAFGYPNLLQSRFLGCRRPRDETCDK